MGNHSLSVSRCGIHIGLFGITKMNKRIKELMIEAGAIKCHGYIPHPELDGHLIWAADSALDTKKMDAEKFAELIVKKCMDIAKYHTPDTEECEYTWLIHDKIKQHFGVEE
jgi:hypothetical protein